MTTDTTTTATDRAAIEALARELTDDGWAARFDVVQRYAHFGDTHEIEEDGLNVEECRALLAYLDEVWAGLVECERDTLAVMCGDADARQWHHSAQLAAAAALRGRSLAVLDGYIYCATPRGRAVLKRAQEMKR